MFICSKMRSILVSFWRSNRSFRSAILVSLALAILLIAGLYLQKSLFSRYSSLKLTSLENANRTRAEHTQRIHQSNKELQYVTCLQGLRDSRGLGNKMFVISAAVYVAELSNRTFVMDETAPGNEKLKLDNAFNLSTVPKIAKLHPNYQYNEAKLQSYEKGVEKLGQIGHPSFNYTVITLNGYFQSWKYVKNVENRIRSLFQFKPNVQQFADNFLMTNKPSNWINYTLVGIHVRRGDCYSRTSVSMGFTVATKSYFTKAMNYFLNKFDHVQFVVVSDDSGWTKSNIVAPEGISSAHINITYSVGHSAAQDMAILVACDHVIMSTGTFGWWAAFLANGTTIYYSNWPVKGSTMDKWFTAADHFPPAWIGME